MALIEIDGLPFLKMGGFSMAMAQITRGYLIRVTGKWWKVIPEKMPK
jgi:hypothetical protein